MDRDSFIQLSSRKAFEIGYALFRIAAILPKKSFADHLEAQALNLIEILSSENWDKAKPALAVIKYFMRIGADTNVIRPEYAEFIIKECENLNSAIAEFKLDNSANNSATLPDFDLSHVFPEDLEILEGTADNSGDPKDQPQPKPQAQPDPPQSFISHNSAIIAEYNTKLRKESILDHLRDQGNCKLKDILESFPDISERTLRYNLQELIEAGLVERIGNSGPGTYYRAVKGSGEISAPREMVFGFGNPNADQIGEAPVETNRLPEDNPRL